MVDSAYRTVDPQRVVVLAFVDRTIRDARHPGARVDELRVSLTLVREGVTWMVESLEPSSGLVAP